MTRFARAKGSKSSNERLPEEATSWAEMKKAMVLKSEKIDTSIKNILTSSKKIQVQEKPSWGNLGDDFCEGSSSLLRQNVESNQVENLSPMISKTEKTTKKKQDLIKKNLNKSDSGLEKKKKRKQPQINEEILDLEEKIDSKVIKKGKKRKISNSNSVQVFKKKIKNDNQENLIKKKKGNENNEQSNKVNNEKSKKLSKGKKRNTLKFEKNDKVQHNSPKDSNNRFGKKFKDSNKFGQKKHKFNSKKQDSATNELIINGEKIRLIKFQGFYVTFKDAERLKKLRADMVKEGIPKAKLEAALKLERRRAEKALSRLKKSVCFHCRGSGHLLTYCPLLMENQNTSTGICYKCGSTEHTSFECKVVKDSSFQFAECFICKEQGHIARQCPDNPKGLYPNGGACRICGDVTHLKKDCPQFLEKKADETITVNVRNNNRDLECLDEEVIYREKKKFNDFPKKKATVKF